MTESTYFIWESCRCSTGLAWGTTAPSGFWLLAAIVMVHESGQQHRRLPHRRISGLEPAPTTTHRWYRRNRNSVWRGFWPFVRWAAICTQLAFYGAQICDGQCTWADPVSRTLDL
jgi:hypothetical protein